MMKIQALEQATTDELRAQGFFAFCLGLLISTMTLWTTAKAPTPAALAVYVAASLVFAGGAAWFAALWWTAQKARQELLDELRAGASR